jgi:hypothetical protein
MTSTSAFVSLPRVPLVPDEIVRQNNVFFEIDTRFRRAARLLQCLWLKDREIETGIHVRGEGDDAIVMPLHSNLSRDAARAGKNFLSPQIHALVRHELLMREEGAAIDEERLFGNALSSMPLCFNLFGPMALNLKLASDVFRKLLPDFVDHVEGFIFEHSPGRREARFLHDGTAWDIAMRIITPDGEPGTVFIEVKYSEDMHGPAARLEVDILSRSIPDWSPPAAIDTLKLAKRLRPGLPSYGLANLGAELGLAENATKLSGKAHHSALYDATLTALILINLLSPLTSQEREVALKDANILDPKQGSFL